MRNHLLMFPWRLTQVDSSYAIAPPLVHLLLHGLLVLGTSTRCVWPSVFCLPTISQSPRAVSVPTLVVDLTSDDDVPMVGLHFGAASSLPPTPPIPISQASQSSCTSASSPDDSPLEYGLPIFPASPIDLDVSPSVPIARPTTSSQVSPSPYGRPMSYPPGPPPPPTVHSSHSFDSESSIDVNTIYLNIYSPPMHERPSPPQSPAHAPAWASPYEPTPSISPFEPIDIDGWASPSMYPLDPYLDWTPDYTGF